MGILERLRNPEPGPCSKCESLRFTIAAQSKALEMAEAAFRKISQLNTFGPCDSLQVGHVHDVSCAVEIAGNSIDAIRSLKAGKP